MNGPRVVVLALALASALTARQGTAQQTRTIEGVVRSAADSTPLAGVRVRVLETGTATETTPQGRFALSGLPTSTVRIAFERIGVVADTLEVRPGVDVVSVYLRLRAVRVSPLVAEAALPARQRFDELVQTSTITLDPVEIKNVPMLAEPDVARVAQLLPGTVAKNDYSVGINVRGGESDQNLIRVDGITIFNPFHLGGLFSTFDVSAVERVDLMTGGFPASFGGRLSSVMDVQFRPGRPDRVGVQGAVSLLSSRILVDGPIAGTGATFMIGGRRTVADILAEAFSDAPFGYYYADGLAKLTIPVGRGHVSATGYWGRDALELPWVTPGPGVDGVDIAFSWGNRLAGVTWVQPVGEVLFEHHVDISQFATRFALVPDQLDARNTVRQLTARSAAAFRLTQANEVHVGVGVEDHRIGYTVRNAGINLNVPDEILLGGRTIPFDFGDLTLSKQVLDLDYRPRVWFAFLDDQWRPFAGLLLRTGVRVEYVAGGAGFTGVSPRIGAKVFITDDLALTGSVGRYYQALHSIRDPEVPITLFDFWIGADAVTPVARADDLVLGFERWFGRDVSVTVEGYTKRYANLPLRNDEDDPRVRGDEFVIATGDAWGLDVLIRRHVGGVRGWVAYSYANTERQVGDVSFVPAHDRRHTLNVVLQALGPFGSAMSVRWGYGSGLPYTGIVGQWVHRKYNAELHIFELPDEEVVSTTINGERYPHYSRLDVGMRWQFNWLGGIWRPYVNVVNAYNRSNVFSYTFDYGAVPPTRSGWSQLPFLPTVGVEFEW